MSSTDAMTVPALHAVVLDLDGTLIDSYAAIRSSLNEVRAWRGLDPLDLTTVRAVVGHGLESLIEEWVDPAVVTEGVRRFRESYESVFLEQTVALPGALETLGSLRACEMRLAVASNKPARFTTRILRHLGLDELIDVVHGPDTVGRTKPDPAMIRRCLAEIGVSREHALYVGDMPLDVESGRRAGVPVVLVEGGSASRDVLVETGVPVLTSLRELPHWVNHVLPERHPERPS